MKIKEEAMLPVASQGGGQPYLVGRWGGHTTTRPGGPFKKVIEKSMVCFARDWARGRNSGEINIS